MIFSPPLLFEQSLPPANASYVGASNSPDNLPGSGWGNSYTFSSLDCGSTSLGSRVVVGVMVTPNATATNSITCTVNGVGATRVANVENGINPALALFIVTASTSGTQNVVIGSGSEMWAVSVVVWRVSLLVSAAAHDTLTSTANPPTGTIDIPGGGVALGIANKTTSTTGWTWAGLTEDMDAASFSKRPTAARLVTASTQAGLTVTATPASGSTPIMCAAAWR